MKKAIPDRPLEEFNCGITNDGPDCEPVGICSDTVDGRGSISARTVRGDLSLVGAFPTFIINGFEVPKVA